MNVSEIRKISSWFAVLTILFLVACTYATATPTAEHPISPKSYTQPAPTRTKIIPTPTDVSVYGVVTAANELNVRLGPGTEYPVVGMVENGKRFILTGRNQDNTWFESGTGSWVSSKYLEVEGNPSKLPVVAYIPVPTQPSSYRPSTDCNCSGNIYNCDDFPTHAAAQACFNYCKSKVGSDVHHLDGDGDGSACDWNP